MALNAEGTLLATASTKGTLLKIFSTEEGELLQELRRGAGKAFITSIVFHPTLNLIACTSNRTSIHLFEIKKSNAEGRQDTQVTGSEMKGENSGENKKSK